MPVLDRLQIALPGELRIDVQSNGGFLVSDEHRLLLGAYLPNVAIHEDPKSTGDVLLSHIESDNPELQVGSQEIQIKDRWEQRFPDDLPHLLYSIARTQWLKRGLFPTHAACIGKDSFTLLPGHSGIGKSTTALEAVRAHDQLLLSGNTTLIEIVDDAIVAVAGTKTMTLRQEDYDRLGFTTGLEHRYGNRIAFEMPRELCTVKPEQIGHIALIRQSADREAWDRLGELSALHTLYPLMHDGEYADCIVAGGQALFSGETPHTAKAELVKGLLRALPHIKLHTGIGSTQFLAQKVTVT